MPKGVGAAIRLDQIGRSGARCAISEYLGQNARPLFLMSHRFCRKPVSAFSFGELSFGTMLQDFVLPRFPDAAHHKPPRTKPLTMRLQRSKSSPSEAVSWQ
ncbi:MAG: hypothetical protein LKM31_04685 [Sphingobium sp.]|nr:hypothetical protein [Sphingobium sp.]MCI2053462.1 hypothetical protein [Sphingobium sp.]